jgi:hypothetical protein
MGQEVNPPNPASANVEFQHQGQNKGGYSFHKWGSSSATNSLTVSVIVIASFALVSSILMPFVANKTTPSPSVQLDRAQINAAVSEALNTADVARRQDLVVLSQKTDLAEIAKATELDAVLKTVTADTVAMQKLTNSGAAADKKIAELETELKSTHAAALKAEEGVLRWATAQQRQSVRGRRRPDAERAVFVVLPEETLPPGIPEKNSWFLAAGDMRAGLRNRFNPRNKDGVEKWYFDVAKNGEADNPLGGVIVRWIKDGPTSEDTIRRISNELEQYECLLVIGHETSTLALQVWQGLYSRSDDPIPVLLLGPTNPRITEDDTAKGTNVVLRMLPDDTGQLKLLNEIIQRSGTPEAKAVHDVLLAVDSSNPVYSEFIAQELVRDTSSGPRICGTLDVSMRRTVLPEYAQVRTLAPRMLVFIGMGEAAIPFVQSLEREWEVAEAIVAAQKDVAKSGVRTPGYEDALATCEWLKKIELVFTDGCASSAFANFLQTRASSKWTGLTVLSPTGPGTGGGRFDYENLGQASHVVAGCLLLDAMIDDKNAKIPGEKLVATDVIRAMQSFRRQPLDPKDKRRIDLTCIGVHDNSSRYVTFDRTGNNVNWRWHEYVVDKRLPGSPIKHVQGPSTSGLQTAEGGD